MDGTIKGGPVCMTITVVAVLGDQKESGWQRDLPILMGSIERAIRATLPTLALGHPPVTIAIVDLPKGEAT